MTEPMPAAHRSWWQVPLAERMAPLRQSESHVFMALSLVIGALTGLAVVAFIVLRGRRPVLRLALVLVFVGAVGNLIDRLSVGYVVDFFEIVGFPVFNVADSCVTVGAILIVLYALVGGGRPSTSPES